MALKDVTMDQLKAGSGYQFSATKIDKLGAAEYTLVTIACDASPSVSDFKTQLEQCLKTILKACAKSDRADNLLLRLTQFDGSVVELHGFKLLKSIDENEYTDILKIGSATAAFDAAAEAIEATATYGKTLTKQDFLVNGIVFLLTDGENNTGRIMDAADVKPKLDAARKAEALESINTVLVGVTRDDNNLNSYLKAVKDDAGFTQYVSIGNATAGKLAKLAEFVSQSISSTSSALGTGSPSQPLNPNQYGF
jgi:hypothetical protein